MIIDSWELKFFESNVENEKYAMKNFFIKIIMYRYLLIVAFLYMLLGSSCSKKNEDSKKVNPIGIIDLDKALYGGKQLYSSVFCKMKTIILDNSKEALIGGISKIDVFNGNIVILDSRVSKGVFVFNSNGDFVRKIGVVGNGPGEYILPFDFSIDDDNGNIYVLDTEARKVNKYDLLSGEYISSISVINNDGSYVNQIYYMEGVLFTNAFFPSNSSDNDHLLQKIDLSSKKQVEKFFTAGETHKGWHNKGTIYSKISYRTNNQSLYIQHFMDTIMSLTPNGVTPFLVIKSKDLTTKDDIKKIANVPSHKIFSEMDKIWLFSNFIEYKDFMYFSYIKGLSHESVVYNVKDGSAQQVTFSNDFLFDEIDHLIPQFGCVTKKGFYNYIENNYIENLKHLISNGLCSDDLDKKEKLIKLDEDSNPVIFYYEFKE